MRTRRQVHHKVRAFANAGRDFKLRAQIVGASRNVPESIAGRRARLRIEADAVVDDFQAYPRVDQAQNDPRSRGFGMAKTIDHGFFGNVQQVRGLVGSELLGRVWVNFDLELRTALAGG